MSSERTVPASGGVDGPATGDGGAPAGESTPVDSRMSAAGQTPIGGTSAAGRAAQSPRRSAGPANPQRADWRRNRARLLAAAAEIMARDGASASLEEIARRAGVGSATLHRHFRSREALLTEVFHEGVEQIAARGRQLGEQEGGGALALWLEEITRYTATTRGLAVSLRPTATVEDDCHGVLAAVAADHAESARAAGRLRPGITVDDLLALANGIAARAEDDPELAGRLLRIAVSGVDPSQGPGPGPYASAGPATAAR
jgi:AcrR family transcriptional regulator